MSKTRKTRWKVGRFEPEHLGALEFYIEALDSDVRKVYDELSIGSQMEAALAPAQANERMKRPKRHTKRTLAARPDARKGSRR